MVSIIQKLEGAGRTDRNAMDASSTSARNFRDVYCMKEIRTVLSSELYDRIGDEPKVAETQINVGTKSKFLTRKK